MSGKDVCNMHGGKSTGPRTADGKARSSAARIITGQYSCKEIEKNSRSLSRIRQLEDAMHIQGMTNAPRTSGRKPSGYKPVLSMLGVISLLLDINSN